MSFIDYDSMAKTTDMRIIKTRRVIFTSLLTLLKTKPLNDISITELCQTAMINRKTFYMHYKTVTEAFGDIENHTVSAYIKHLQKREIISSRDFKPAEFILETNAIVTENLEAFSIVYPYFRRGRFMRRFGAEIGALARSFSADRSFESESDPDAYCFSFIFTATGLLTSYFDWVDFGKQLNIEHIAHIAANALSIPLNSVLSSK